MNWYLDVLKKYAVFSGRARRQEYWMFALISTIVSIILGVLDHSMGLKGAGYGTGVLQGLYSLAVLIPSIAVSVRRLHDTDRTGWWLLIFFIPLIGFIVLFIFMVQDSQAGDNQYGPNPKAATA